MKFFPLLTAVGVVGVSLFTSPSAMAFWGAKMPTYSWLKNDWNILQQNQKNLIYNSDAWITGHIEEETGTVRKIKLVGCSRNKCIFYMRIADDRRRDKYISVQMIDCVTRSRAMKVGMGVDRGKWTPFTKISGDYYEAKAYRSFC